MNTRRGLVMLSLSILLHALFVLALGGLLTTPSRVIQHIEVTLGPTAGAPQSMGETPAPSPAPATTPQPELSEPEPASTPAPKPIAKAVKRPAPRIVESQPVIKDIEPAKPEVMETVSIAPKTPRAATTNTTEINAETEGDSNTGSSSKSATAEESSPGTGQKTDASALQAYLAAIRARIAAAKRYPMMAERRRIEGEVVVSFRLSFDGHLLGEPEVTGSSGSSLLDGAAVRAVKRAAPFPRFPGPRDEMLTKPLSVELDFVIR
jgi:protein TonB